MLRTIQEVQPRWVVGENVLGLTNWNGGLVFNEVYDDLEREGYEVQSFLIPAASVNAPHQRYRIWFVANSISIGRRENVRFTNRESDVTNQNGKTGDFTYSNNIGSILWDSKEERKIQSGFKLKSLHSIQKWKTFPTKSPICGGDDGLPRELDNITFSKWRNESIKAYGNAIVPQVAHQLFKTIEEFELMVNK
jgi:DNA (cytosine-5)-methyltransferase 1